MYTEHFGLKVQPFDNSYDSKFFFDQGDHARIRRRIKDSLKANPGLTVVTGATGSGKTTLSQMIMSDFLNEIEIIWMAEPPKYGKELFLLIARELGLKQSASERVFVINDIKDAIINSEGSKCLLIIDESHLMADGTLSSITILNNLQEGTTKLIHVLLFGSEEMLERMSRPDMKPFKQRVAILEHIGEMSPDDIRGYILHRIKEAGGDPSIISDSGLEALILACSTGGAVPGLINLLCSRSLRIAFEKNKEKVEIDDVCKAADGMGIAKEVYRYMVTLRATEGRRKTASSNINEPVREVSITGKELEQSCDSRSEDAMINQTETPESSPGEPENVSAPEKEKKGFRSHCKAFLKKVLRKGEGTPEEKIEAATFPIEAEEEVSGEMELAESRENEPEEKSEAEAEVSPVEMMKDTGSKIKDSDVKEEKYEGDDDSTSEWVTTDIKGTKSFSLADDKKEKINIKKKPASSPEKQARPGVKDSGELKALDKKKAKYRDQDPDSSSEWLTIDRKGLKSFTPSHTKENKKKRKEKAVEDIDGWVTTSAAGTPGKMKGPGAGERASQKNEDNGFSSEWVKVDIKNAMSLKSAETEKKSKAEKKKTERKTAKRKTVKKKAVKKKTAVKLEK